MKKKDGTLPRQWAHLTLARIFFRQRTEKKSMKRKLYGELDGIIGRFTKRRDGLRGRGM